jgi:hypothetical protein
MATKPFMVNLVGRTSSSLQELIDKSEEFMKTGKIIKAFME